MALKSTANLALILLLVLLSFGWTDGAAKAQKVTITMGEYSFSPAKVTFQAGVAAEIKLVNKGTLKHEFMAYLAPKGKVSDWDDYVMANTYFRDIGEVEGEFEGVGAIAGTRVFEVQVQPRKEAELRFVPTRRGTFEMACHVEGHYDAGMKGVFVVK